MTISGSYVPQSFRRATLVCGLATVLIAAMSSPALAQTYTVTRTDDPPPRNCIPGDCTLREAVNAADNNGPGASDTIVLQAGQTYTLQQHAGSLPSELGGALIVLHNIDLKSVKSCRVPWSPDLCPGATDAVINGNGSVTGDRVFDVLGGGLTLHDTDVTGGVGGQVGQNGGGGVLVSSGVFYMFGGTVQGNSAPSVGAEGGGIDNYGGHVVLQRALVAGNDADGGFGGGMFTGAGALTEIYDSKLFDNQADFGGALASWPTASPGTGSVLVDRAQMSFNRATENGGAAFAGNGDVSYDLRNATINNNVAGGLGGALRASGASVTLNNDTLTLNNAPSGGAISAHGSGAVWLHDTIVAQNLSSGPNPDCVDDNGNVGSQGYNIVGNVTGCETGLLILHPGPDQLGGALGPIDAKLEPPAYNGGPFPLLLTAAPKPGSPAIDNGDPSGGCEPTDARSVPRSAGGRCDIGAFERVPPALTSSRVTGIQAHRATATATLTPSAATANVYAQYSTNTQYGTRTPTQQIGGSGPMPISMVLTGLRPGKTYHCRIVVTSRDGTTRSRDHAFTTRRH